MHFHALKYLLNFLLVIKVISSAKTSINLNEVSDFNDIVEKEYQSDPNLQLKEEIGSPRKSFNSVDRKEPSLTNFQISYETPEDNFIRDSVFSPPVLSYSDNQKNSLCPKHTVTEPQNNEENQQSDDEEPQSIRLLPVHREFESPGTVVIKSNNLPNAKTQIPESEDVRTPDESKDHVHDIDSANKDEQCENCEKIKDLFPIPLLESILINKLLESNYKSKPYPIKYVVKSVIPNFKNVEELDKPDSQQCLKTYLQRRKRELEYLSKRNVRTKRKKKKKKKKKPKKKKKKSRRHRSINDNFEGQLNGMIAYISKNQTFNDTFTYMPLIFGTMTPAENQMLIAGIKNDASAEEKFLLQKILSIRPDELTSHANNSTVAQSVQTTAAMAQSVDTSHASNQPIQETVKYNLNLNLNSPEVKKTFMEIMQRQQNIDTYEASTTKVKRDAVTLEASQSPAASSNVSTVNGALGLIVTSPPPQNEVNVVPGIIIYPKNAKQKRKRFASDAPELGGTNLLNQADINTILKTIDKSSNEKNEAYVEAPKSKKQCKNDKCVDQTDEIMDAINSLYHPQLKSEDVGFEEYSSSSLAPLTAAVDVPTVSSDSKQQYSDFKSNPEMEGKLARLQKDLKMVKEIQNIFDGMSNTKNIRQQKKRSVKNKDLNKIIKNLWLQPDENRYDYVLNSIIKARMWQKRNKSLCEDKVKKLYSGKNRSRRFLARG